MSDQKFTVPAVEPVSPEWIATGVGANMTPEDFGEIAYETYRDAVGGRSAITGEPLPTWQQQLVQRPGVAEAWVAVAQAVRSAVAAHLVAMIAQDGQPPEGTD